MASQLAKASHANTITKDSPSRLSKATSSLNGNANGFTHLSSLGTDSGFFSLKELRGDDHEGKTHRGGSRIIAFPLARYTKPPQFAKGLKSCHFSHQSRDKTFHRALDFSLTILTHPTNISTFRPIIQALNSNSSTKLLFDAEMSWLETKQGAKDCMFFTTRRQNERVEFPPGWRKSDYEILCWIKDFRFRTCDDTVPYKCDAWATDVSEEGFTAVRSGSGNLERLATTWIVYDKCKRKVDSGTFSTEEKAGSSGRVEFAEGRFVKTPTVLVAMSQFDIAGGQDLRIGARVVNVDHTGFDWEIYGDGIRSVEATYIALGFTPRPSWDSPDPSAPS